MARDRRLEIALGRLDGLIEWATEHDEQLQRNEAATRLHLIDELLIHVLTWPRDQVQPEEHSCAGYADYVLGRPQRRLVIEAKREGRAFHLPPETPVETTLPTLFKLDPDLEEVVQQARRYASELGLEYGAVCNGHQLVAFLATRTDGIEPLKGRALAFPSLEAMRDNFGLLWNGLSKVAVEGRRLSVRLGRETSTAPPLKASNYITGYRGLARTDSLVTNLRMLGELFLIDLVEHPNVSDDFLRECYLDSGALSQHASVSRQILKARYSALLGEQLHVDIAPARTKKGVPSELLSDLTTASLSSRPIILLGYVGVGKTMFIRHLVRIEARNLLDKAIVLSADLGREPALEQLEPFIAERFIRVLADDYDIHIFDRDFAHRVYERELKEFQRGPWGSLLDTHPEQYLLKEVEHLARLMDVREAHLRESLTYLAGVMRRQIVTILDNVDQRDATVQDRVFLIAETMAKSWPGTVFIALRPDTFNRSKREGTLNAYQPRVFAVAPPRIDRVLDKRIRFAQKQIYERTELPETLEALSQADELHKYLEIIRLSLRRSKALAELVDNLSGQNARRALELLTTLLGSPHARPAHALKRLEANGHYSIPYHEFLRALMLGERERYDPDSSRVINLLDVSSLDGREHFLLPIIIALLRRAAEPGVREGYVSADRVYAHCQELGFRPEQVAWQLDRAVLKSAIEAMPIEGPPELYRASAIGSYAEQRLLGELTYLDEISIDTPIVVDQIRALMHDAGPTSERLDRAERFRAYLDDQWKPLAGTEDGFDWMPHSAKVEAAIAGVENRLKGRRSATHQG